MKIFMFSPILLFQVLEQFMCVFFTYIILQTEYEFSACFAHFPDYLVT